MNDNEMEIELKNKRVCFSDSPDLVVVDTEEPLTDEEKKNVWYSRKDIQSFRKQSYVLIAATKNGWLDDTQNCVRGLERSIHFPPGMRRREKKRTIHSILHEQEYQKSVGLKDPNALRILSSACTQWERENALQLAAMDALFAAMWCNEAVQHECKYTVAVFEPFNVVHNTPRGEWPSQETTHHDYHRHLSVEVHLQANKENERPRFHRETPHFPITASGSRRRNVVPFANRPQNRRIFWHAMATL